MDYKFKQLERELSALSKAFSELGVRLSEVAKEVTSPGAMPSEKLLEQISASRTSFESVRTAVHGHAGSMLVSPLPKLGELVSIVAIDSLLKASAVAEESKFSIETEREKALVILGRVLAITHRESAEFKPLQECQTRLGELRSAISNVLWPHQHPESESIVGSRHPSNALLSFVENLDTLDDEKWMALETTITESYGKPLFVAASRGKLTVQPAVKAEVPPAVKADAQPVVSKPPAAAPAPPKPPVAAAPEPPRPPVAIEKPVEKPVEKKIVAEKAPEKPAFAPPPAPPAPAVAPAASVEKKVPLPPAPATPPPAAPIPAIAAEKKEVTLEKAPQRPTAPAAAVAHTASAPVASSEKKESPEKPHAAPVPVSSAPSPSASVPAAPLAHPPAAIASATPSPAPVAVSVSPAPSTPVAPAPVAATPATPPRPPAPAPVAASAAPAIVASSAPAPVAAAPAPVVHAPAPAAPPIPAAPVAANHSHAAPTPPAQHATMNSLTALATATEPAVDRKSIAPTPIDAIDKQRKEPRLAAPAPQQVAKSEPNAEELVAEQAQGGPDGQRPQRWGFWRGNR